MYVLDPFCYVPNHTQTSRLKHDSNNFGGTEICSNVLFLFNTILAGVVQLWSRESIFKNGSLTLTRMVLLLAESSPRAVGWISQYPSLGLFYSLLDFPMMYQLSFKNSDIERTMHKMLSFVALPQKSHNITVFTNYLHSRGEKIVPTSKRRAIKVTHQEEIPE